MIVLSLSLPMQNVHSYQNQATLTGTGHSGKILARGFRNCVIGLSTSGTVDMTAKIKIGYGDTVDFTAAASSTNNWAYASSVDLAVPGKVAGTTGYALTTAGQKNIEVDVNAVDWVGVEVSAHTSGTLVVSFTLTDNL